MLQPVPVPVGIALLLITAVAACFDIRTRRIPNWLSLAGCCSGLAINSAFAGFSGLRTALLGLSLGFVLYFPLWLIGARGAGDVKLLAAAGSLVGPPNTLGLFILAALLGGVWALGLIVMRGVTRQTLLNVIGILSALARLQRPPHTLASAGALRMPHAVVIFLAAITELLVLMKLRNA